MVVKTFYRRCQLGGGIQHKRKSDVVIDFSIKLDTTGRRVANSLNGGHMYLFNSLRVVGRLLALAGETALQRRQPVLVVLAHGLGVLGRADLGGLAGGEVVAQLDLGGGTLALDG